MTTCEGPLIWYDVAVPTATGDNHAILECARLDCDYIIVSGSFNDEAHSGTPLLREGMATA